MIVVDLGLRSSRSRVRLAAVELTAELCNRLPLDVLRENLTSLVLGLFSVLENCHPFPSGDAKGKWTLWWFMSEDWFCD